ncbi:pentapeptide repeat-containing protein [Microbacterium sp. cx-59]|uniref:pentapeptide repeat-containing protein n=1 Tax=Microbacterium sp. cx-59 TaxID=2891207 RepID=UPI001E4647E1|nr:pentapeptide repeat-containing protein [Microbacterium sp. cx-59]MCC4908131.1 pentapeptide repeat-containing protein [Microbacterium sp. cx-59]
MTNRSRAQAERPRPPRITPIVDVTREPIESASLLTHSNLELVEISGDLTGVDLEGIGLSESLLRDISARELHLRSASLVETRLVRVDAPVLGAASLSLRDVVVQDSRIGSAELYDSTWQSVHVTGCRLGYLNLRSARLTDLLFTDCTIDELDLSAAVVSRMAFRDTTVRALTLHGARLTDVDLRTLDPGRIDGIEGLRGASLSTDQLQALAPALAEALGIHIAD